MRTSYIHHWHHQTPWLWSKNCIEKKRDMIINFDKTIFVSMDCEISQDRLINASIIKCHTWISTQTLILCLHSMRHLIGIVKAMTSLQYTFPPVALFFLTMVSKTIYVCFSSGGEKKGRRCDERLHKNEYIKLQRVKNDLSSNNGE